MKDNITQQLINELTEDDLTESQKYIASEIGMDNFIKISLNTGGGTFCFPNRQNLLKNVIYRRVRKEFDGANYKELAAKYGISHSSVYNIIRKNISKH